MAVKTSLQTLFFSHDQFLYLIQKREMIIEENRGGQWNTALLSSLKPLSQTKQDRILQCFPPSLPVSVPLYYRSFTFVY